MYGCFPTAKVDNQPLAFSHYKAVVYPWECCFHICSVPIEEKEVEVSNRQSGTGGYNEGTE
jgi:hypothetical protein